ncbi:hypothetical protein CSAL01_01759 [Colletotrichum salicis]|uniref:AMP-dependent synthetase/ligase domain-containing protein n=1 Tax=Colletotrichum salicis TaxID=1209931 RepID=A0A135V6S1_9PEZI|nr:hypothetical protein CSAL01_01759 [Colletotrichum salicis]
MLPLARESLDYSFEYRPDWASGTLRRRGIDKYYNDRESTVTAFTHDGWFTTGDFACVNQDAQSSDTEQIVVAYLPSIEEDDTRIRTKTRNRIVDLVGIHTSSSAIVLPLKAMDLKSSALGKLPRSAFKTAFENGAYNQGLREASEAYVVDHDVAGGTASPIETTSYGEESAAWMYSVADPLKEVAVDREDWVENKLSRWRDFADDVQFHDVPGEHYSMLGEINVSKFARKLKDILEARECRLRHVPPAAPRLRPAHST